MSTDSFFRIAQPLAGRETSAGIGPDEVRTTGGAPPPNGPASRFTIEASKVMQRAEMIARLMNHKQVNALHALYAMMLTPESRDRFGLRQATDGRKFEARVVQGECVRGLAMEPTIDQMSNGEVNQGQDLLDVIAHAGTVASRRDPEHQAIGIDDLLDGMAVPHLSPNLAPYFGVARAKSVEELTAETVTSLQQGIERVIGDLECDRRASTSWREEVAENSKYLVDTLSTISTEIGGLKGLITGGMNVHAEVNAGFEQLQYELEQIRSEINRLREPPTVIHEPSPVAIAPT